MILLIDPEELLTPLLSACLASSAPVLRTIAELDPDNCDLCDCVAILIVGGLAERWVGPLRRIAGTGVPVVRIDEAGEAEDLGSEEAWYRRLPLAFDLAALRHVLPAAVGEHLRADDGGAIDRLGVLLGKEAAADMVARFHVGLAEGVAAIEGGADMAPIGHRLGGMAGMLGLPLLSAAWLGLQRDPRLWPAARAITTETLRKAGIDLAQA